jgi:hypothetical protein
MRKLVFYLSCILLICTGIGTLNAETIEGNGKIVTKQIDVFDFDEITLLMPATVIFTQSDEYSCTVTIDENLLQFVSVKTIGDDLHIRQLPSKNGKPLLSFSIGDKDVNIPHYQYATLQFTKFEINISAPRLEDVIVTGSGFFTLANDFADQKLNVNINGSGKFMAEQQVKVKELDVSIAGTGSAAITQLLVDEAEVTISGSGSVELNGIYNEVDLKINGSGEITAYGEAPRANAKIAGSGNIYLGKIAQNLKYDIAGTGNIYYSGTPELFGFAVGSGKIFYKEIPNSIR